MSTHRYWRLSGLSARGAESPLTLSELQLRDSATLLTAGLAPVATLEPNSGTLAALTDGSTSGLVSWAAKRLPSLRLTWDFGSAVEATDIQVGSGVQQDEFLLSALLDCSDDGNVWVTTLSYFAVRWPGANALTASAPPSPLWDKKLVPNGCTVSGDGKLAYVSLQGTVRGATYCSTGKRQFEVTFNAPAGASGPDGINYLALGVGIQEPAAGGLGHVSGTFAIISDSAAMMAGTSVPYGNFASGEVIGVVVDFSVGSLTFYKNGVSMGVASATGLLGLSVSPRVSDRAGWDGRNVSASIEPQAFAYPVAGAAPWVEPSTVLLEALPLGRVTVTDGARVAFTGAQNPVPNLAPCVTDTLTQGNWLDPGNGRVAATVKLKSDPANKPLRRRVRLVRESDGMVVRETWSDSLTGAYAFEGLRTDYVYSVISYDHLHDKRAEIADGLTLENGGVELMP